MAEYRVQLVETGVLRRVWRLTGASDATVEWNVLNAGLDSVLGYERVLVNGTVAARDLALTRMYVPRYDFLIPSPGGSLPASIELNIVLAFHVAALRFCIEGKLVYGEGDLHRLKARLPNLPVVADASDRFDQYLPVPARPPSVETTALPVTIELGAGGADAPQETHS